ncbi:Bug family tripartite tricarboxylate transporter substrate binding protein [Comamonas koreensis]|uniref:Tripartite tricarboxylate transporter substrate binding protein n=1 Tax=Comamonas koreensis TaxID=160825 RepID=A0AAW4Y2L2_9BURK|nr:tripartite tricarboxylate transporter substrate-binding protein [Comamonas koreensis]MCD2167640.1 tripartite tricarboxylate transporter substrate binding protein [Comamonas koreensis]
MKRRQCASTLLALGTMPWATFAQPRLSTRHIRVVVPFGPGGVADLTVRIVVQRMGELLGGQPIVVDNRPGAGGVVAAEQVARTAPDGHVLLLMSNANAVAETLFASLPYSAVRDFAPISLLGSFDLAVLVAHTSAIDSLQTLAEQALARPGQLNIGTSYPGSTQHLAAELLKTTLGLDVQIVPFNSSAPLANALRGQQIDAAVDTLAPSLPHIQGKLLRAAAVMGAQRSPLLPQVPTVAESMPAAKGFEVASWNALAAPAGTPVATITRLSDVTNAALASPSVQHQLQRLGIGARGSTPAQQAALLQSEIQRWATVIERAGIAKH